MRIYYTGKDCGDGSLSVHFFDNAKSIELWEEYDPEGYRGEGGGSFEVIGEIKGLDFETLEDTIDELLDWDYIGEEEADELRKKNNI